VIFHLSIPIPYYVPAFIIRIGLWFLLRYRKKHCGMEFRRIKLYCDKNQTKNRYAIIDPEDYERLTRYEWHFSQNKKKKYYAVRLAGWKNISMHREIINAPPGKFVDHINGNGLDNRKKNLRFVTATENSRNCKKRSSPTTSKYKGVSKVKKNNKWRAYINTPKSKYNHLGYFHNEIDAAKAYDKAAKELFGEFASPNLKEKILSSP
jgi:hypothetical protein